MEALVLEMALATLLAFICLPVAEAGEIHFRQLSRSALEARLTNHSVTDDAHWADVFLEDGELSGHRLGIPQHGRWKIDTAGDLCITNAVKIDEEDCFQVWVAFDRVEYRQGDILLDEGIIKPLPQ